MTPSERRITEERGPVNNRDDPPIIVTSSLQLPKNKLIHSSKARSPHSRTRNKNELPLDLAGFKNGAQSRHAHALGSTMRPSRSPKASLIRRSGTNYVSG